MIRLETGHRKPGLCAGFTFLKNFHYLFDNELGTPYIEDIHRVTETRHLNRSRP